MLLLDGQEAYQDRRFSDVYLDGCPVVIVDILRRTGGNPAHTSAPKSRLSVAQPIAHNRIPSAYPFRGVT